MDRAPIKMLYVATVYVANASLLALDPMFAYPREPAPEVALAAISGLLAMLGLAWDAALVGEPVA